MVKNPPSNVGDKGSILGRGTKIPHAVGQLSPRVTTTELTLLNKRAHMPQTTEPMCSGARAPQLQSPCTLEPTHHNQREKTHTPQLERSSHTTTKSLHTKMKILHAATRPDTAKKKGRGSKKR